MSNGFQYYVDTSKISTNFNVALTVFRCKFDLQKIDVLLTYFVDVTLIGKKSISFRCTLLGLISMGENWHRFHVLFSNLLSRRKMDVVLMYSFDEISMNANWWNFYVLILMCFWKAENCTCFDIIFWYVFDILRIKVVWASLFNIILFPCTF